MRIKVGVIFGGESVEHEISIITAIQAMNKIDEEKYEIIPIYITKDREWYTGDMLKFGTTSVNGSLVLELSTPVNCIKITGYVSNASCAIRVGDSNSLDWDGGSDGMTVTHTCSEMNVTTKEVVEGNQVVTITLYFEATTSLKIAVTNKKTLYITAIELIATSN